MQSAPLLPTHWSLQCKEFQPRNESSSFWTYRQLLGRWHLSHDPLPTSSGRSRRRSGQRHVSGLGVRPQRRSTACRRAKNPMARWPTVPKGSPRGTTSRRCWNCFSPLRRGAPTEATQQQRRRQQRHSNGDGSNAGSNAIAMAMAGEPW